MKFSIVTPTYNMAPYIKETIESVISQSGDFEIEYIIIDGKSTDETRTLVEGYQHALSQGHIPIACNHLEIIFISEKDSGMYDAINKGFALATGDIYAWINADDYYHPDVFDIIQRVFVSYKNIDWMIGITTVEAHGSYTDLPCYTYKRKWISAGIYGIYAHFIHQNAVFWRKDLWSKVNNIPQTYTHAGDYWLWKHFAKHAQLVTINKPVSIFRKRAGQLSQNMSLYRQEQKQIGYPKSYRMFFIKLFFTSKKFFPRMIQSLLYRVVSLYYKASIINCDSSIPKIEHTYSYIYMREKLKHIFFIKVPVVLFRIMLNEHSYTKRLYLIIKYLGEYRAYIKLKPNPHVKIATADLYPRLYDNTTDTHIDPIYFYQNTWCAEKIFQQQPIEHVDIASHALLVGIIAKFVKTTMVDIRPLTVDLPELQFKKGSILCLPFDNESISSLSSICVIEHIGLGRYGDDLDQYGTEKAAKEIGRVVKGGGNVYISVPIDTENKTYFNAHRAFTRDYIVSLFPHFQVLEERYIYGNSVCKEYQAQKGFGTGLFYLQKYE